MDHPEKQDQDVYEIRKAKLAQLRQAGFNYPNTFHKTHLAYVLIAQYQHDALPSSSIEVAVAGRIVLRRIMGKASFIHLQDTSGRIQVYVRQNDIQDYAGFKAWDLGDLIGVKGELFKTKTQELTIHAREIMLLTKSLRPLPDKFHGLIDQEMRYRQRYLDLMVNEKTQQLFKVRSHIIQIIRHVMDAHHFLEVETPMMHPIPGGAIAKPFVTHHHALNKAMFLRIAPELYLKRLIVGGFERVYEINRNFRNEGLSTRHNPEFTMIEFYQAYANYLDLMPFTETLLTTVCQEVLGKTHFTYQDHVIDFTPPFQRLTIEEAILKAHPDITLAALQSTTHCIQHLKRLNIEHDKTQSLHVLQMILFEETVEKTLIQPTFIIGYPTVVSPLARQNQQDPTLTDRFELFIAGREIANAFSELNDPEEQAKRFREQVALKDAGDAEAMHYDKDYIEALEYGMPPTAGEGIGIDRLVMLLTDAPAIRDVILFPQMR